jgi:hypothetical protein
MGNWLPSWTTTTTTTTTTTESKKSKASVQQLVSRTTTLLAGNNITLGNMQLKWLDSMADSIAGEPWYPWFGSMARRQCKSDMIAACAVAQSTFVSSGLVTIVVSTNNSRLAMLGRIDRFRAPIHKQNLEWKSSDIDVLVLSNNADTRRMQLSAMSGVAFFDEWRLLEPLEKLWVSESVRNTLIELGVKPTVRTTGMTTPTGAVDEIPADANHYYPLDVSQQQQQQQATV